VRSSLNSAPRGHSLRGILFEGNLSLSHVPPPIPPTVPAEEPDPEPIPPPPVQQAVPTRPTLTLKKAVALPTAVRADVRSIAVAAPLRKDRLGR